MADEYYPFPVIDDTRMPLAQNHFVGANSGREVWFLPPPPPPPPPPHSQNPLPLSQPRLQPQPQQQQKRQRQNPPSQNRAAKASPRRRQSRPTNAARQFQQELERQEKEFALQIGKDDAAQVEKEAYFREEKERRLIRDDEEMHKGLVDFKGNQRGWNGERESDRQRTLQPYREQENTTFKSQGKSPQPSTEEQSKPKPNLAKKQQEKANKILEDEMRAATMAVLNQREINNVFFDDYVKQKQEETHKYLTSRRWDLDAIKAEARADFKARAEGMPLSKPQHARGRRKSSSVEQHEEGSPLESGSSQGSDTQRRRRLSTTERRGSNTEQQIYGGRKTRSSEAERLAQDGILGIGSSSPVISRRQSKKPKFYGQADVEDLH